MTPPEQDRRRLAAMAELVGSTWGTEATEAARAQRKADEAEDARRHPRSWLRKTSPAVDLESARGYGGANVRR